MSIKFNQIQKKILIFVDFKNININNYLTLIFWRLVLYLNMKSSSFIKIKKKNVYLIN